MNLTIFPLAMCEIVGQVEFFNLGMASGQEQAKTGEGCSLQGYSYPRYATSAIAP